MGAYFQDDWKVTKRLTLNLGLRYDLFTRHNEEDNLATTFIPGPGSPSGANTLLAVTTANSPANCLTPSQVAIGPIGRRMRPGWFCPVQEPG